MVCGAETFWRGSCTCKIDAETQNIKRITASRQIMRFLWFLRNFADFSLPLLVILALERKLVVSTVILFIFYFLHTFRSNSTNSSSKAFENASLNWLSADCNIAQKGRTKTYSKREKRSNDPREIRRKMFKKIRRHKNPSTTCERSLTSNDQKQTENSFLDLFFCMLLFISSSFRLFFISDFSALHSGEKNMCKLMGSITEGQNYRR